MKRVILLISVCVGALLAASCGTPATPTLASTAAPVSEVPVESSPILYRSNPQRTGLYDVPAIRIQPQVKWRSEISSSWLLPPMVADGMLFTGSGDGVLYALDSETGTQLWSTGGFEAFEMTGAIVDDLIVTGGYNKMVKAFDRWTGEERWSFHTGNDVQGSPLVMEDRVVIATSQAVYSLNLQSGDLVWKTATGNTNAFMGAPAYDAGVIYTTGGKLLLALDFETGDEIWRVESPQNFLGLAVANGLVYVGNFDQNLYAFEQSTGAERWKFEAGGEFWSAPAADHEFVYAGNTDHYLYALDAWTGELAWSFDSGGDAVSEALIAGDVVYFSDSSHLFPSGLRRLYALDAQTGEELWMFEAISRFLPAPALADGVIYITSGGEMIALSEP